MAKETQNIHLGLKRQISFHNLQYFHDLQYFHVCAPGLTPCLGHNLFEGIVQHDLALNIKYLIKKKQWFTYEELNKRIVQFKFIGGDQSTKPPTVSTFRVKRRTGSRKLESPQVSSFDHR